nr:MAG TPA: hypothetical protein [Caudoviricetes sp.]
MLRLWQLPPPPARQRQKRVHQSEQAFCFLP